MNCFTGDAERLISDELLLCTAPNPAQQRSQPNSRGSSVAGTIFLLVNSTLGAGLLNLPQAFDESGGLVSSISTQLFLLVFVTSSLVILASCSDLTESSSLQRTMSTLFGEPALAVCACCVAVYSFGCCLTFLIVVGDQLDRVLATYYGTDYCDSWYLSRGFVTAVSSGALLLPLCFFRTLHVLSYASSVGCFTVVYVAAVVVYEYAKRGPPSGGNGMRIWPESGYEALRIVPVVCFAYQSHVTAIPLYACMKRRSLPLFASCATLSMLLCFLAYTTVAVAGYATFGSGNVPSDILQGYADPSALLTLAVLSVALKNFTTYPIVLFCGRDAIFSLIRRDPDSNGALRSLVTVCWFAATLTLALLLPDISAVVNLLGSLSAAFIFLFPGIAMFRAVLLKDSQLHLNKDRLMVGFTVLLTAIGAFVVALVLVETVQDLGKREHQAKLVRGFGLVSRSLCVR